MYSSLLIYKIHESHFLCCKPNSLWKLLSSLDPNPSSPLWCCGWDTADHISACQLALLLDSAKKVCSERDTKETERIKKKDTHSFLFHVKPSFPFLFLLLLCRKCAFVLKEADSFPTHGIRLITSPCQHPFLESGISAPKGPSLMLLIFSNFKLFPLLLIPQVTSCCL